MPEGIMIVDQNSIERGRTVYVDFSLTVPTSAVAADDILADTQVISGALVSEALGGTLQSITLCDADHNASSVGLSIFFLTDNISFGTENSPPDIADANGLAIKQAVDISSADWKDFGAFKWVNYNGLALPLRSKSGTTDLYIAAVANSAGTFMSGAIKGTLGILMG